MNSWRALTLSALARIREAEQPPQGEALTSGVMVCPPITSTIAYEDFTISWYALQRLNSHTRRFFIINELSVVTRTVTRPAVTGTTVVGVSPKRALRRPAIYNHPARDRNPVTAGMLIVFSLCPSLACVDDNRGSLPNSFERKETPPGPWYPRGL